jgi:hypothetical protein
MTRTLTRSFTHAFTGALLTAASLCVCSPVSAATVHLANIVPVATAVNDFELAPAFLANTWAQQGVRAVQAFGDPGLGQMWMASGFGNGNRSWFPDGGDNGFTRIWLDTHEPFDGIAFFGGSGWLSPEQTMYYELALDNVVVLSGSLPATFFGSWFGFAGGDFDEVRIRASQGNVNGLFDCPSGGIGGNCNFAWLDDIRVGAAVVPVPSTAWLVLPALLAAAGARRRA